MFLSEDGKVMVKPKLERDLRSFMRQWSKNLKEQGYFNGSNGRAVDHGYHR